MILIAKAVKADALKIAELEHSLSLETQRFRRIVLASNLKKKFKSENERFFGSQRKLILKAVDEENGVIAGFLSAGIRKHSPRYAVRNYVYAYTLYVLPAYRRKGVAKKLFRALFSWAKRVGVREIVLKTQVRNAVAIKAYRTLGFRDSSIEMKKFI